MYLEVLTPERKLYSGEVYGVQLPGTDGLFEVLENHAPLISSLHEGKLKVLVDKQSNIFFQIKGGFVEVLNNRATVLVEGATALDN